MAQPADTIELPPVDAEELDPVPRASAWEPGTVLGRYVLDRQLGAGTMGVVFLATDPELDRQVALKVVPRDGRRAERTRRLVREARALASVKHPNVVTVYDAGTSASGDVFIAMELVQGRTLSQWSEDDRPKATAVRKVFAAAARGLQAAHDAGIVHRDFKPDNVMIESTGRVAVLDFGLAHAVGSEPGASPSQSTLAPETTATHPTIGVVGTPAYMAPEHQLHGKSSAQSDQFSLCVATWEALYREHPFGRGSARKVAERAAQGRIADPEHARRVPRALQRVLRRGLAAHPEDRWPSLAALVDALEPSGLARSKLGLLAATTLGAAIVTGAILGGPDPGCEDVELAPVWGDAMRNELRTALGTIPPGGPAAAARLTERVDAYGRRWTATWKRACTIATTSPSPEAFAPSEQCLLGRRRTLEALLTALVESPEAAITEGDAAVFNLPDAELCLDPLPAEDRVAPPPPAVAEEVAGLERSLERVRALESIGRVDDGLSVLDRVEPQARTLEYAPLTAEMVRLRGLLLSLRGEPTAGDALREAYALAVASGAHTTAALAATRLVETVGHDRGEGEAGRTWATVARAHLERTRLPIETELTIQHAVAATYRADRDLDRATAAFERTLILATQELPAKHPLVRQIRSNLAGTYLVVGRHEDARRELQRLFSELAAEVGPDDPRLAPILSQLGSANVRLGNLEVGVEQLTEAIRLLEVEHDAEHVSLTVPVNSLAAALFEAQDYARAEPVFARLLALARKNFPPGHQIFLIAHVNAGEMSERQGDLARAAELYAIALRDCPIDDPPLRCAAAFTAMGRLELARGAPSAALPLLRRALALRRRSGGDPLTIPEVEFHLGRALLATASGHDDGLQMALGAALRLQDAAPHWEHLARQARVFLARHASP